MRPGFTCTAEITTATRQQAVSVPIQAWSCARLIFDDKGNIVRSRATTSASAGSHDDRLRAADLPAGQKRKELEGVFVVQGREREFLPVKTGIAGDKLLRGPLGLKEGDQVITGPFNSVRDLQDGDKVMNCRRRPTGRKKKSGEAARRTMTAVLRSHHAGPLLRLGEQAPFVHDGAGQHRRGDVHHRGGVAHPGHEQLRGRRPRHEVGIGTFRIDRVGVITDEEQEGEARRRNPVITRRRPGGPQGRPGDRGRDGRIRNRANVTFRNETIEAVRIRGLSSEYDQFSGYEAARGGRPRRLEMERDRPGLLPGFGDRRQALQGPPAVDQLINVGGQHFRVVGVNEKKGSLFGNSQDDFVLIPLGKFQQMFGTRRSLELTVKPTDPVAARRRRWKRRGSRCGWTAGCVRRTRTTSGSSRPTR